MEWRHPALDTLPQRCASHPRSSYRLPLPRFVVYKAWVGFGNDPALVLLAAHADLFIAHNAVPEGVTGIERNVHMPPSVIGQIAADAHVKHLVLSHRMLRTLGKEGQSQSEIRKRYAGPLDFADDLECFPVP